MEVGQLWESAIPATGMIECKSMTTERMGYVFESYFCNEQVSKSLYDSDYRGAGIIVGSWTNFRNYNIFPFLEKLLE